MKRSFLGTARAAMRLIACLCLGATACAPPLNGDLQLAIKARADKLATADAALFAPARRDNDLGCGADGRRVPVGTIDLVALDDDVIRAELELDDDEDALLASIALPRDPAAVLVIPLAWSDVDGDGAMGDGETCEFFGSKDNGLFGVEHIIAIEGGGVRMFEPQPILDERWLEQSELETRFFATFL
jgi:hypothetical protein